MRAALSAWVEGVVSFSVVGLAASAGMTWSALSSQALAAPPEAASAPVARSLAAPQRVADGVWVFEGAPEHFSRANGGDIVNTGFIETADGAVVIDTGPSLRYGQAQRAAVRQASGREVKQVLITHAHPDHFLGSQAYADVPVQALAGTVEAIRRDGDLLAQNLYLLVGGAMAGTAVQVPATLPRLGRAAVPGQSPVLGDTATLQVGGRSLRLIALAGHTGADLAVFDERTGTLFAGDLVFFERAPTTPNADIAVWLAALDRLQALPFTVLVPGHGPVVRDARAIAQTRDYLQWVRDTLERAAADGLDMNEVMRTSAPQRLQRLAVLQAEWPRTVMHLYPSAEAHSLPPAPAR